MKNSIRFAPILLFLALQGFGFLPGATARPYLFGCGYTPSNWIGRPPEYDGQCVERLVEMGARATSFSGGWISVETERGVWDWVDEDRKANVASQGGLAVFGYVGTTPYWALPPHLQDDPSAYYRNPPMEEFAEDFMYYCRTLAARYAGRIDYWTFWNEPNGCSWVNDGCANMDGYPLYVHWLKRAYTALKEGNPNCKVAAGNLDYHDGVPGHLYIEGMYSVGAKGYFDAINIHPYAANEIYWKAIEDTREVMVRNGDADKTIWIGEYGWHNSLASNAPNMLTSVLSRLSSPEFHYVEMANYLILNDLPLPEVPSYGLCDRDLNRRPIFYAFRDFPKNIPTPTPTITGTPPTPVPTHTSTITPTPSPTPKRAPLRNSGLDGEDGFQPPPGGVLLSGNHAWRFNGIATLEAPTWWYPFWNTGVIPHLPGIYYIQPQFQVTSLQAPWLNPPRIHAGGRSVSIFTLYNVIDAGIYQSVGVTPGKRYRFEGYGHAWSTCDMDVLTSGCSSGWDPYQAGLSCGIDPTGGTDFLAETIIWGDPVSVYDTYQLLPAVETVAVSNTITVFLRGRFKWGFRNNYLFFDTMTLSEPDSPAIAPKLLLH